MKLNAMDTVQEIAIYFHRFHNLDLFQQGFYQIKVSMKWEDSVRTTSGTPARVVQYEAHDLSYDHICGSWKIDDTENSFLTQPFWIKYARQDVHLTIMISFDLSLSKREVPPTSAVILKFELMQSPVKENRIELLAYVDPISVAIHEFRIPPKALLGLHAYCPIHFDIFHAVLVEASIHVCLSNSGSSSRIPKGSYHLGDDADENIDRIKQALGSVGFGGKKKIMLVKSLIIARDTLLEQLQRIGRSIDQAIDLTDFISKMNDVKISDSIMNMDLSSYMEVGPTYNLQNDIEKDSLVNILNLLHTQLSYLWGTFLQFHRKNKTKILEYLRNEWAEDRKAEWSIWMVYSKVEMPHHYISSGNHDSSHHAVDKRVTSFWKLPDEPIHLAATRAELHRRSIAEMRMNSQSIQDMHIFGDPFRMPIIFVERVINSPRRTLSDNSYFRNLNLIDSSGMLTALPAEALKKIPHRLHSRKRGRVLKLVVFVHGFQGHHLDLRLVRNQWLLLDPTAEVLMSEANEDKTTGNFSEMGQRLAQEVISFLKRKAGKLSKSNSLKDIKLSFVGHSIGNIIIRSALAESTMEPYRKYLYTYVSISGPQLGYLYSSNSLFNSGMWFMKKFKGTQCIHQLTFTDEPNLKNTFFYKLCEQKTLENFRHIILISSPQDGYVPYHSARVELSRAAAMDYSKKGRVFVEMLNNCLDQIRAPTSTSDERVFMRCDVNFDTSSFANNLNTFIGRTAHIEFLETDIYARFIMWSFPHLFR